MSGSNTDAGRKPRVTDKDILGVFRKSDDPVLSTAEVADALPIKRRGTLNRLQSLEETGALESKTIGGRNTVWWLVIVARDRRERAVEDTADRSDTSPPATGESDSTPPEGIVEAVGRVAEGWDDTHDRLEARKRAARAVLEYAEEHGGVSKQEAKAKIYPEHPVEAQNPRTWWKKNVRPVFQEVGEYDRGTHSWRLELEE